MISPMPTDVPFPPYRWRTEADKLVFDSEYTLRDVVFDHYITGSVTWLLGYQADHALNGQMQVDGKLLRAQSHDSPYETGWSVLLLLDTLEMTRVLGKSLGQLELFARAEISVATEYLLAEGRRLAERDAEKLINWEDLYDTAVVLHSLLRAKEHALIPDDSEGDFRAAIMGGLRWLGREIFRHPPQYQLTPRIIDDLTLHGGESLAVILPFMVHAWKTSPKEFSRIFGASREKLHPAARTLLEHTISFVEQGYQLQDDPRTESLHLPVRHEVLISLAGVLADRNTRQSSLSTDRLNIIRRVLLQSVEVLERLVLQESVQPDTSNRASRLTAYISCLIAFATQDADQMAFVVGQLRSIVHAMEPFGDGSTYHSLYATRNTLRALLEVCRWSEADQKIIELYDQRLKASSISLFDVRSQIYQLRKESTALKDRNQHLAEDTKSQKTKIRQLRRISLLLALFILLSIAAIWVLPQLGIGHVTFTHDPTQTDAFLALVALVLGLTAALATGLEIILFRDGHSE